MKKIIILLALSLVLMGCKKSNIEQEIDEYDLRKAKLGYLKDLLDTKQELESKEKLKIIDSLILEEKTRINDDRN
jgi:putative ubiquitin-RnfH superfamily antitoxin RatB of RatAB toxin-antitoxin module